MLCDAINIIIMCYMMQLTFVPYGEIDKYAVRCNIDICAECYNRLALYDTVDIWQVSLSACYGVYSVGPTAS